MTAKKGVACRYGVDQQVGYPSISLRTPNPHAFSKSCGTYFESLFFRTQSRSAWESTYSCGDNLSRLTICSKALGAAVTGATSGLPQFGLPRRFTMNTPIRILSIDST